MISTPSIDRRNLLLAGGVAATLAAGSPGLAQAASRGPARNIPFDGDWRFHLADAAGAEQPAFDDSTWRALSLPHDWSIEDREGAPKTTGDWTPPDALWNPTPRSADAPFVSPDLPIVMAQIPAPGPNSPPLKVGPFDAEASAAGWGTGFTVGGVGWYRKHFLVENLKPGEQMEIRFDGAYQVAEVWLNGQALGRNVNGYQGFAFDLTPHLLAGANVLAVKVSNIGQTARWYSGSGLYRHVWLSRTGTARVPLSGMAVTTTAADATTATVSVMVEVENRAVSAATVACRIQIRTPRGRVVASTNKTVSLAAGETGRVTAELVIARPELWSPDTPSLNVADISLVADRQTTDQISQKFGIRTVTVSPETGLQINGTTHQLRGVCLHHDHGILGAVALDAAERRKVELVKANGFNAIRCSHNPYSPHFLDVCDELGMIVIDEAFDVWEQPKLLTDYYDKFFAEHWRTDLAAMVRRDRNHPSIVFWSIGNEIMEAITPHGIEIAGQMRAVILEQDTSRFITQALLGYTAGAVGEGARGQLDVIGYNYNFAALPADHAAHPQLTFMTTESHPEDSWDIKQSMDQNPFHLGEFVWTGMDYIGEVGTGSSRLMSDTAGPPPPVMYKGIDIGKLKFYLWDYPAYQSGCGEIDLLGLKKPASHYRDVVWGRSDLALFVQRPTPEGFHEDMTSWGWPDELESWTWPVDSAAMTVRAYARGDEVVLLLNGQEVARKSLAATDKLKAVFQIPYHPGALTAVSYSNGQEVARKTIETVGAPARLRLRAERSRRAGDPVWMFAEVCDAQGRLVPDASIPLTFELEGGARLLAAGSANPRGIESFKDNVTRSFHGTALAIFQPTRQRGEATIRVVSPGIEGGRQSIRLG